MISMRIGYFADGPWAHRAFEKLIQDSSVEIAFICVRYDSRDSVLCEYAKKYNIPLECFKNINENDSIIKIRSYNLDIIVSMSFNQIFKKQLIELTPLKIINCHAGKLPFYRGRNILNWVLINDEEEFGITVHYVDEGIDTGDIILQRTFPISDQDTYKTLLDRSYVECGNILYDAIKLIQEEKVQIIEQDTIDEFGTYFGMRQSGDEIVDFNQTSRAVFNFIRAITVPGPCARAFINGIEIRLISARMVPESKKYINTIGQVVGKTPNSFYVKTQDTIIEIVEYKYDGNVRIGDRLKQEKE